MTFDPSKPLKTWDGSIKWDSNGSTLGIVWLGNPNLDLINVPEPRVFYLCIGNEMILPADHSDGNYRITLTEGQPPKIEEVK